jgi:hypothetical protein
VTDGDSVSVAIELEPSPAPPPVQRSYSQDAVIANVQKQMEKFSEMSTTAQALVEMGFSLDEAQVACIYSKDLNSAVDFLTVDKSVDKHNFIAGDHAEVCAICFKERALHTSSIEVEEKKMMPPISAAPKIDEPKPQVQDELRSKSAPLCLICFCSIEGVDQMATLKCGHFFCKQCIAMWIESRTNDGKVAQKFISCPDEGCRRPLYINEIQSLASPEIWAKFQRFQNNHNVDRDPNARWCSNPLCSNPVYRPAAGCCGGSSNCECESCGLRMCFYCGKEPHGRFERCNKADEENMVNWAGDDVQRCPSCRNVILREAGCNHMTCNCGYEFCWVCGSKYTRWHFQPLNPCGCPGMHEASVVGKCLLPCTRTPIRRFFFRIVMFLMVLVGVPLWIALQFASIPLWCLFWLFAIPYAWWGFGESICDWTSRQGDNFMFWVLFPCLCCIFSLMDLFS